MAADRHLMEYGDRIHARVVIAGREEGNYIIDRVSDMSELIGELRERSQWLRGLAKLYIRNITRGWSVMRPMMFSKGAEPSADRSPSRIIGGRHVAFC